MVNLGVFTQVVLAFTSLTNLTILLVGLVSILNKVEIIHKATNSMKDELVAEVRSASFAKGVEDEKAKMNVRPVD